MDDNNELIPIIIDISQDIETIDPDSFNITIVYDTDNIHIPLNDVTDEIIINIENNTIPIYIKIINEQYQIDPFQIIINNNMTINDLIHDLELYYIGIPNSIISIKHQNTDITQDTHFILYNNCSLSIFIDNNIEIGSSLNHNNLSIDPNETSILHLFLSNLEQPISPQKLTSQQINTMDTVSFSNINTNNVIVGDTCVICSIEYEANSNLRILPCKHVFHQECIDKWLLNYSNKCPICKQ